MEKLRLLRKEKHRTQQQMADYLGISQQAYATYENNKALPPIDIMERLADYFNVSIDYILGRDETPTLTIPKTLTDTQIAFAEGLKDLDDEELQQIADFVDFLKNRKK